MLSPSFIPCSFLIYSTLRSAFSQSPQRKFYGIFLIKTMQKSSNLKTVQNIILFFSLHPVLWNKGLEVKRITFDRILLYWKVSMNNPRDVGWDMTDPSILENCTLCGRGNCCSSSSFRKGRLSQLSPAWGMAVSPGDPADESLRSVRQCCVSCSAAGCVPESFSETLSSLTRLENEWRVTCLCDISQDWIMTFIL